VAAGYYKVIAPNGSVKQCHGGNKREIRNAISGFAGARLPAGTRILFYWGHRKNYRGELFFRKRKAVLSEDLRKHLG
jgi:hypothetical protein